MGGRRLRTFSWEDVSRDTTSDLLATSDEKFIAQSICKTRSELKDEHFPGSNDQLSETFLQ